jgi:PST family polysaccharide transporter
MIAKFKSKFQSENSKKISANFMYLSILQGMNLILPLITFPYLVRVLGIENFGLLMFAQAFIVYFTMIVDYGFNLSGIREVSSNRNNKSKLIKIFSSIMIARFILALVGLIFLTIIVFSFEKFSQNWELYYLTFGIVIGTALFPTWFFQGMEKMKYITVLTVIAKLIFTLSIFLFVTTEKDFIYVPLINSLGFIFVGFISLFIIFKDFNIRIKFQKWKRIKIQFIKGWYIII